jgi:alpha-L-fucosidase
LFDIYLKSVGRGASLLLNIPVYRRGLIHENDAEQLLKFTGKLKSHFNGDKAAGNAASASNSRGKSKKFAASNVNDRDKDTYWATDDSVTAASLVIDFKESLEIHYFIVQEYIKLGQRVRVFSVEALVDDCWIEVASGTTIGYKRILEFEPIKATGIKFSIQDSKECPVISNIEVY